MFTRSNRSTLKGFEGSGPRWQPFFGEQLRDRAPFFVVRPFKITFRTIQEFAVPLLDALDFREGNDKIPTDIADFVFDVSLLVARRRVAEADREAIVAFEPQEQLGEGDRLADAPPNARCVVEHDTARYAADTREDIFETLGHALRGLAIKHLQVPGVAGGEGQGEILDRLPDPRLDDIRFPEISL